MSRQGIPRQRSFENVRQFWESEAAEIGETPQVTIRDHWFRIHELHTLQALIPKCGALLDIGCGTGFGTMMFARRAKRTVGGDYSEGMIEWARRLVSDRNYRDQIARQLSPLWPFDEPQVDFHVIDILAPDIPGSPFDVITGQRILINLPTHDEQMAALSNLRAAAAPEALLILVEATLQGHARTNACRAHFGVPALEKYWHNNYVDEARYDEWADFGWRVKAKLSFDTYVLFSKVAYPAAVGEPNCRFLSGANQAAMEVANLFRTAGAAREIGGDEALLEFYSDRVSRYDAAEADAISRWASDNARVLDDWSGLGHQRLVIAEAI